MSHRPPRPSRPELARGARGGGGPTRSALSRSCAAALLAAALAAPLCAAEGQTGWPRQLRWAEIPSSALATLPLKPVDPDVVVHERERRGFVTVPLDYGDASGRTIEIFYRLLPTTGDAEPDGSAPILLFMNGGPGAPASAYRPLDYDYDAAPHDALSELSRYFRILAVDQRGTGSSAPLDLDDPALSPEVIARYFDSDEHARDHARVVDQVVPGREHFFALARSYGGEIGFHYLLDDSARRPAGFIFSSAVLPHSDALETFLLRRRRQKELNLELQRTRPGTVGKLVRLRAHLESLGLEGAAVHLLWPSLGRSPDWSAELDERLDQLLEISDPTTMSSELGHGIGETVNLLNYVLSSAALTPGYTDRSITVETSRQIPFEAWMLDENWVLNQIGRDGTWREEFIAAVDRNPPPPTRFPPPEEIRAALGRVRALFTFGRSDAFLPQELQLERARRFHVPGHTELRTFDGGHGAAFGAEGARFLRDWATRVLEERTAPDPP
ncbi:MAG: alpha/beta fold hydrolase [Thermoanaerobaculia bacterium]|nr:alpha/beta fold hydrolase [Thermoanaerobaculia bacterium]